MGMHAEDFKAYVHWLTDIEEMRGIEAYRVELRAVSDGYGDEE
jgi:hypothetical protein